MSFDENLHETLDEDDDGDTDIDTEEEEEEEEANDNEYDRNSDNSQENKDSGKENNVMVSHEECEFVEHTAKINSLKEHERTSVNNAVNNTSSVQKTNVNKVRKVSFAEVQDNGDSNNDIVDEIESVVINFKHSDVLPKSNHYNGNGEATCRIISPADIYRTVTHTSLSTPKSILKKSISVTQNVEDCTPNQKLNEDEKNDLDILRKQRSVSNLQVVSIN